MSFVNPLHFNDVPQSARQSVQSHSITGASAHAPTVPEGTVWLGFKADRTAELRCCRGSLERTPHRNTNPSVLRLSICCRPVIGHTPRKLPSKGRNLPLHRTSSLDIVSHLASQSNGMRRIFCKLLVNEDKVISFLRNE